MRRRKRNRGRENVRILCDWKTNYKRQVPSSSKLYLLPGLICTIIFVCEGYAAFLMEKSGSAVTLRAKQS